MPSATVYVVDDDDLFRRSIVRLLKAADYDVVEHKTAADLIDMSPDAGRGCILLDLRLPGIDGLEVQARLAESGSTLPIIFLTGHGDIETTVRAVKAGAEDFLSKPVPKEKLLKAVEQALTKHDALNRRNSELASFSSRLNTLSPREREVFGLIIRGKLNKQVAHELGTTVRTIKAHRRKVMEKLQATSLASVVTLAERSGVLAQDSDGAPQRKAG